MINVTLPRAGSGTDADPFGPDSSALPAGVAIASYRIAGDGQSYEAEIDGPPELVALVGLALATDPASQANRAMFRLVFDRINELARAMGRDDLLVVEPEAFSLISQAIGSGLGRPGQRSDT